MTAVMPIGPAQTTVDLASDRPGRMGAALVRPAVEVVRSGARPWGRGWLKRGVDASLVFVASVWWSPVAVPGALMPWVFDVALALVWVSLLSATCAFDLSAVNYALEDVRRVLRAGVALCATALLLAAAVGGTARQEELVAVCASATAAAVAWRWAITRPALLRRCPAVGVRTVVAGHRHDVDRLVQELSVTPSRISVVGECVVGGPRLAGRSGTVETELADLRECIARSRADAVVVAPCRHLDPIGLRRLGWELEVAGTSLFVATGLADLGPARTRLGHAGRLPLVHVRHVELRGRRRGLKAVVECLMAALALLALAPFLAVLAALIRLDSAGPVLYRQTRVGRDGRPFTMLKFRTMVVDADHRRAALVESTGGADVLFKLRDDPRITRLGRVLRRYSLDELPQLVNVLRGEMSLVGPRPPLPEEVQRYQPDTHRRLVVRPGITGLWQVSGRSDLSWEESVRIDLRYVENWSLSLDVWIMCRTLRAVVGHRGAY